MFSGIEQVLESTGLSSFVNLVESRGGRDWVGVASPSSCKGKDSFLGSEH